MKAKFDNGIGERSVTGPSSSNTATLPPENVAASGLFMGTKRQAVVDELAACYFRMKGNAASGL